MLVRRSLIILICAVSQGHEAQAYDDALSFPLPFTGRRCFVERTEALGPTLGPFL